MVVCESFESGNIFTLSDLKLELEFLYLGKIFFNTSKYKNEFKDFDFGSILLIAKSKCELPLFFIIIISYMSF